MNFDTQNSLKLKSFALPYLGEEGGGGIFLIHTVVLNK